MGNVLHSHCNYLTRTGCETHDIEAAYNTIVYSGGAPPGLLGGYNLSGHDNVVNGNTTKDGWVLWAYNNVWHDVYYDGERIA